MVAVGLFLPLLGWSLLGFILLDTAVGMAKRRRIRQTAMSEADGMATSASRDMQ